MQAEPEFDLVAFVKSLDARHIRYVLIGRWAVILHGAPMMTADYDFWIAPEHKDRLLRFLSAQQWEVPDNTLWKSPVMTVFCGVDRIDLFFYRSISNLESQRLSFDQCWKRSVERRDPNTGFRLRLPSLADLILLKKMPRSNSADAARDAEDVRYLESIRRMSP